MPVILRMAFRNLFEHKAKSLIIGILLALGMLIMVLGNSFLDASKRGLEASFTKNYTGDVIITGVADGPVSLFGVQSTSGLDETPTIPDYEKVYNYAQNLPETEKICGMASSFAMASRGEDAGNSSDEDEDTEAMMASIFMLFGIDANNYWDMFSNTKVVNGELLKPGVSGIMIAQNRIEKLEKFLKRKLAIGDEILLQGMSVGSIRLRSVKLVGTFEMPSDGAAPMQLTYIDINTLRSLSGMTVGASENISLSSSETAMLEVSDLDSLFDSDSEDNLFGEEGFGSIEEVSNANTIAEEDFSTLLGDVSAREDLNKADTGAWHSILLRLNNSSKARAVIAELNAYFVAEGIAAQAGDWQKAAGQYAQSVDVIRIVFTVAIIILAVVAMIVIMNTMVVSIMERTGEIGTMRALGANKNFIRKLFNFESLTLSFVFGIIGMILAALAALIINSIGIEASNQLLEVLFGGKILNIILQPLAMLWALGVIMVVGLISSIYPVSVALRIMPVKAMQA